MKIIAGSLKGRQILTAKEFSYKPITSMLKESIFSILSSGQFIDRKTGLPVLQNASIIDAFGGTGAFTFEAISRGAAKSIVIEKDPQNVEALQHNAERMGIEDKVTIIRGDALHLQTSTVEYSVAFIDPPFNKGFVPECVKNLVKKNWLARDAILVIRTHAHEKYDISEFCKEIFSRTYGKHSLSIYRKNHD